MLQWYLSALSSLVLLRSFFCSEGFSLSSMIFLGSNSKASLDENVSSVVVLAFASEVRMRKNKG